LESLTPHVVDTILDVVFGLVTGGVTRHLLDVSLTMEMGLFMCCEVEKSQLVFLAGVIGEPGDQDSILAVRAGFDAWTDVDTLG
jgi:hypothetical protein